MRYLNAVGKLCWGYFFIYINLYIGTIDILPTWVGFLLIYAALDGVAVMDPSAKLIKPFALLLMAESGAEWMLEIFGATVDLYWIDILIGAISLYFHFQLLTNLAGIAESRESAYSNKLKKLRSMQTVFLTIMALMPVGQKVNISLAENGVFVFVLGLASVVVMLSICIVLFRYRKELQAMEEKALS